MVDLIFAFSPTSAVAHHGPLALQPSVALLGSSVAHLWGRRVNVRVGLLRVGGVPLTLRAVLVGASEGGWIHLHQSTSGGHVVEHVDTGGHSRVQPFPFHVGHVTALKAVAIGDDHFPVGVLGRPLLPPPLTAAGLHLTVFSQVVSKVVSVGSDELVSVFVVNSVYCRRRGLFGFARVEAVWCNGSAEHFILGDET